MRSTLSIILIILVAATLLSGIGYILHTKTSHSESEVHYNYTYTDSTIDLTEKEIEERVERWWNEPANITNGDWLYLQTKVALLETAIYELNKSQHGRTKKQLTHLLIAMQDRDILHYHINYIMDGRIK